MTGDQDTMDDTQAPRRMVIPFIVAFAFVMEQLDTTMIATAIPAMAQSFDVSPLRLNLLITAYVLSLAVFIPISGWCADRWGAKRIFCLALVVFMVASAACSLAQTLPTMVFWRVIQGMGGAMMTPVGRLILLRSFDRRELVTAMSYMTAPVLIGPMLGPLISGAVISVTSWRVIFLLNIPVGLIGLWLAMHFITEQPRPERTPFDATGFMICAAALVIFQMSIENLMHPLLPSLASGAVFLFGIALFGFYARRSARVARPPLDLTIFSLRSFRVGSLAGGLSRIGLNAVPFLLPLQLQIGLGLSALSSGLLVSISTIGALMMKPLNGFLLRRHGFRHVLMINAGIGCAMVAGFTLFTPATPIWLMAGYIFLFGVMRTIQFNSVNILSYADVPHEKQSASVGLAGVVQQLSMSLGVSLSAVAVNINAQGQPLEFWHFSSVFLMAATLPALSIWGFWRLQDSDGAEASGHVTKRRM